MNWRKQNNHTPRAFIEWIHNTVTRAALCELQWSDKLENSLNYQFNGRTCHIWLTELNLLSLPDYFDKLLITIEVKYNPIFKYYQAHCIFGNGYNHITDTEGRVMNFSTRRDALEAGIRLAFVIREEQLKEISQ